MNFKIVSSNIRFDNPSDENFSWPHRKELLAHCFEKFQADIIGTQEGREGQLRELEDLLNKNIQIVDSHRKWIKERMYPTLYVNKDKIYIENSGDIWLSDTPYIAGSKAFDSAFPRLCTWIIAASKESGKTFFVVNTHLDHVNESTRLEQIKVLLNETRKINGANHPLILMGDFNTDPKSEIRKQVYEMETNIYDPWIEFNMQEESTYHKFQGNYPEGSRIDWILLDKRFRTINLELDKTHQNDLYPSDHFPVKAELEL